MSRASTAKQYQPVSRLPDEPGRRTAPQRVQTRWREPSAVQVAGETTCQSPKLWAQTASVIS